LETAQPVLTVSRADIERQGFNSVADILQNLTATGSPALSRASPLSAGEAAGGSYVNMRGLGAQRTLVLVNGKRWSTSLAGFTDMSTIPTSLIERIEVLKDGASAIYGSDAISGVVNIILKERMDGGTLNVRGGAYSDGGGASFRVSGANGFNSKDDRFRALVNVQYEKTNPIWGYQRDITK
ncbi:TonB-dependent receptor plug domain-containing protein, partial [Enterobacter hormaechei]|uniref:TonB-dependent receptor plug domain-containing protein n=1 Tax=Enterobacter hormaechei TaxID=158836 RepID=UPI00203C353A